MPNSPPYYPANFAETKERMWSLAKRQWIIMGLVAATENMILWQTERSNSLCHLHIIGCFSKQRDKDEISVHLHWNILSV